MLGCRLKIEFLQDVLYLTAPHRLADFGRPVVIAFLAPWIDLLKDLQLLFFEGAQPLLYFGY